MKPKYNLLREAYAIIGGIPDNVIDLRSIQKVKGESLSCGTICCAFGWLGHHPKFQALGLRTVEHTWKKITLHGFPTEYRLAAAELFDITEHEAVDLFGMVFESRYDKDASRGLSDKQLWMYRVRRYLADHD